MGKYAVGGKVSRVERESGAHPDKSVAGRALDQEAEFGKPAPELPGRGRRRKLTDEERGPGFFDDTAAPKNPRRVEYESTPERPLNFVKVLRGQFSTGPLNSEAEDNGGTLEGAAWVVSPGEKLNVHGDAGFEAWIAEVETDNDIRLLRTHGWWPESQISKESRDAQKKPKEAKTLKLRLR
jgi:hypothetical protein